MHASTERLEMRETAYAKVNLALHIRAREADGYHRLETVFAFAEDGDLLEVAEPHVPGAIELELSGPFAAALHADPENLVLHAAAALREHYGVSRGARLRLDKRLPVAAGIGGGSADAAAALRLLVRWWGLPHEPAQLHRIARALGADVPACIDSLLVRGDGRGDELTPIPDAGLTGRPLLLVNPRVSVPTGRVFRAWDGVDRGPLGTALCGRNDLEAPARRIAPEIGEVLAALEGAPFSGMSGSGATCLGLYERTGDRDAAAARIAAARPDWWLLVTGLR
jgi:4-diphosphocytidyl-2-C-methyl-D-erythritol kinase